MRVVKNFPALENETSKRALDRANEFAYDAFRRENERRRLKVKVVELGHGALVTWENGFTKLPAAAR